MPLLEAVAKLRTERDVELVIVGRAKEGGAAARAIERLGLEDAVTFMTGLTEKALVDVFGSAHVGVVPSLYEGFSLPAIELMSCATPLVATTAGALPEVVGDAALHGAARRHRGSWPRRSPGSSTTTSWPPGSARPAASG